jgi:hypothetical protein
VDSLNCAPDAAYEAFLEMGLQQDVVYAAAAAFFQNIPIRIAGDENDQVSISRFRNRTPQGQYRSLPHL